MAIDVRTLLGKAPVGRRSNTFLVLFGVILALNLIGLVMVLSASQVTDLHAEGTSWYHFDRQAIAVAMGAVAMVVALRVDYRRWRRFSIPLYGITFLLLLAVLIPGVGVNANGASRWIGVGPLQLQPSEFAKLSILLLGADILDRRWHLVEVRHATLHPLLVALGLFAGLVMLQPNLGTTIILTGITFLLLFVAGSPLGTLSTVFGVAGVLGTFAALAEPYRRARVMAFLNPWNDPTNTGYQTIQSMVGMASGGLTGSGLGQSRAKWGFLPYAHTDFIFAIIGEELGLIGALVVVALFVTLGVLGVRTAMRAPDPFGQLLATGVTCWILLQAFINIGAVIGALPITGVPLPFVSYGGSSLVVTMAASGVLLNIARQSG